MNLHSIVNFFDHPVFIITGGLTVCSAVIGILYRALCSLLGISPLVFRIGKALWRRKIALFGNTEAFSKLSLCLIDSGVFKKRNIDHIPDDNIDKAKNYTVYLVDWDSSNLKIDKILSSRKNHNTAVVIYAKPGSIPNEKMSEIANQSNTVVVNFRGRLLNDLINSMLTTSFDGN
jgi:hypothetical protein